MTSDKELKAIRGVYGLFNENSGQAYIGASGNIINRWKRLLRRFNNGKGRGSLQKEWGKNLFTFVLLEAVPDRRVSLPKKELFWIKRFPYHYNICMGSPGKPGKPLPSEVRKKISVRLKGHTLPLASRERIRILATGRLHSPEAKEKISQNNPWRRPEFRKRMLKALKARNLARRGKNRAN